MGIFSTIPQVTRYPEACRACGPGYPATRATRRRTRRGEPLTQRGDTAQTDGAVLYRRSHASAPVPGHASSRFHGTPRRCRPFHI